jgi:ATPase subunit of ABC transporter with duplicated ATPase domains
VDILLPPSLLAFSGVGKRFPDGTVALAGVDLSVAPGELVSILGPSGCGKSTLLRVAAGLSQASDGTAKVGTDKIGYVFRTRPTPRSSTSRATPPAPPREASVLRTAVDRVAGSRRCPTHGLGLSVL